MVLDQYTTVPVHVYTLTCLNSILIILTEEVCLELEWWMFDGLLNCRVYRMNINRYFKHSWEKLKGHVTHTPTINEKYLTWDITNNRYYGYTRSNWLCGDISIKSVPKSSNSSPMLQNVKHQGICRGQGTGTSVTLPWTWLVIWRLIQKLSGFWAT